MLQAVGVDRHPLCAAAALPCSDQGGALVAAHPRGLLLLRRDGGGEEEVWRRVVAETEADLQSGECAGGGKRVVVHGPGLQGAGGKSFSFIIGRPHHP